ncbi:kinase-like domain-containing protein [Lobosporangium transversale]|uniref:Kinase-like domain-containing protein n=1 Tax=Lobosporangium transversale TaxID=64571 RepID=A0A1Y2GGJ5_9FUNG|nr:kinase-like domain-containing protein [Lobosporangium transversale]ORZ10332.1 kinase-like domain-containing protein [Lobosporangium transversale]|eukprot:XP_021879239.1 kinase-like domain-containing protein [Lobosporangium transversale]
MAEATQTFQRAGRKASFFFLPHTRPTPPTPTSPPSPTVDIPIASAMPAVMAVSPAFPLVLEKKQYLSPSSSTISAAAAAAAVAAAVEAIQYYNPRREASLPPTPQHDLLSHTLAPSAIPLNESNGSPSSSSTHHSLLVARSMDQFVVLQELGNGSFGSVVQARHKVSGELALEVLRFGPNIIKLHHFFLEKKELHMVFELMEGNLYQLIQDQNGVRLEESRIKSIVFQVLRGLQHMHAKGVMHRDMKPENLLISGDTVKIADLGLARELKSRPPYTTYVSTRWYRSPEVVLKSTAYSSAVDLWAIGAIAAELISLKPLFPGNSDIDQIMRIGSVLGSPAPRQPQPQPQPDAFAPGESLNGISPKVGGEWKEGVQIAARMGFAFPATPLRTLREALPNATEEALELITGVLQYDPKNRLTAYQALHSNWFRDMPETEELKFLTDVVQQSPDKRRSMFSGLRKKDIKEKDKDRRRGLSISLPIGLASSTALNAMLSKPAGTHTAVANGQQFHPSPQASPSQQQLQQSQQSQQSQQPSSSASLLQQQQQQQQQQQRQLQQRQQALQRLQSESPQGDELSVCQYPQHPQLQQTTRPQADLGLPEISPLSPF